MIYIFYANRLHHKCEDIDGFLEFRIVDCNTEIYNGAYILVTKKHGRFVPGWWRMDGTPCLIEDVPKATRAMALILT